MDRFEAEIINRAKVELKEDVRLSWPSRFKERVSASDLEKENILDVFFYGADVRFAERTISPSGCRHRHTRKCAGNDYGFRFPTFTERNSERKHRYARVYSARISRRIILCRNPLFENTFEPAEFHEPRNCYALDSCVCVKKTTLVISRRAVLLVKI